MPRPSINQLMIGVFSPLVSISGSQRFIASLRTKDLPNDIKEEQYRRIKSVSVSLDETLLLGRDNFLTRIKCEGQTFIAINIERFGSDERNSLYDILVSDGLIEHRLEECFFLHLRFFLGDIYQVKSSFRNADYLRNIIDVVNEDYAGHDILDIIECFDNLIVFRVPDDNVYVSSTLWEVACQLAAKLPTLRSPIINPVLAKKIQLLSTHEGIPADNIYVALTAIHWKYIFFELYKCLERIFYLPWHYKLKQEISYTDSAMKLSKICQSEIEWRAQEEASIKSLFELADSSLFDQDLQSVSAFSGIGNAINNQSVYGRRIYKIRNILVHQQDFKDHTPLHIKETEWEGIIYFMCSIVNDIYSRFAAEIIE